MRPIALLPLAFVCSACILSFPTTYDVDVDAAFSDDEKAQIVDALEEWQEATGTHFNVRIVNEWPERLDSEAVLIARFWGVCPGGVRLSDHDPADGETVGLYYHAIGGRVECLDTDAEPASNGRTRRLALHETGHLLGLRHVPKGYSVMRPWIGDAADHVTPIDMKQYRELHGGDP